MNTLINDPRVEALYKSVGAEAQPLKETEIIAELLSCGAILHGRYNSDDDTICIDPTYPRRALVAIHELAHWTGHKSRLNRLPSMRDVPESQTPFIKGREELITSVATAFIAAFLGFSGDEAVSELLATEAPPPGTYNRETLSDDAGREVVRIIEFLEPHINKVLGDQKQGV